MINEKEIKQQAHSTGFHKVGITTISATENEQREAVNHLQDWLQKGYQADMAWMDNPKRQDIRQCWGEGRSIIAVALNYYTPHQRENNPNIGKISRYGWGRDYHRIMHKKLKKLSQWLENQHPTIKTRYYADTAPVQDKFWAQQAGIGWIAKNGNVITRDYGSWVFLGEIITNLELQPDQPHTNHCGTCSRCITACPTNAITAPSVVDANRCLAYHTIENREEKLPDHITPHLNGWVAGCDICQDVCPWNERFAQPTDVEDFNPYAQNLNPSLTDLAHMSDEEWDQRFTGSALRRIKPAMWRRNAQTQINE